MAPKTATFKPASDARPPGPASVLRLSVMRGNTEVPRARRVLAGVTSRRAVVSEANMVGWVLLGSTTTRLLFVVDGAVKAPSSVAIVNRDKG